MRIWTSSWFTRLPNEIQRVAISRGVPGAPGDFRPLFQLAPGTWFKSASPEEYHQLFMEQLGKLDAGAIVAKLEELGEGRDVCLLCFEAPHKFEDWCHRGQVSAWLSDQLQIEVFEHGLERCGCGWAHPKLWSGVRQGDPLPTSPPPARKRKGKPPADEPDLLAPGKETRARLWKWHTRCIRELAPSGSMRKVADVLYDLFWPGGSATVEAVLALFERNGTLAAEEIHDTLVALDLAGLITRDGSRIYPKDG